jgi:hypothetical protein
LSGAAREKSMEQNVRTVIFLLMFFSALYHSTLRIRPFSFDHPVRPRQHIGRNSEADLLGGFQVDD